MQVYQPGGIGQPYQYTGDPYTGDPYAYKFADGGQVGAPNDKRAQFEQQLGWSSNGGGNGNFWNSNGHGNGNFLSNLFGGLAGKGKGRNVTRDHMDGQPPAAGPQVPQGPTSSAFPNFNAMGPGSANGNRSMKTANGRPMSVPPSVATPQQIPLNINPTAQIAGPTPTASPTFTPATFQPVTGYAGGGPIELGDNPMVSALTFDPMRAMLGYDPASRALGVDDSVDPLNAMLGVHYGKKAVKEEMAPQYSGGWQPPTKGYAGGGIASMPGKVDPRQVQQLQQARQVPGADPGMADSVPARVDGKAPAKLSSGEVVIPADVVSMLGDGNTQAGAQMLRQMVQRVRQEKTGNPAQAPAMNQRSVMPA